MKDYLGFMEDGSVVEADSFDTSVLPVNTYAFYIKDNEWYLWELDHDGASYWKSLLIEEVPPTYRLLALIHT